MWIEKTLQSRIENHSPSRKPFSVSLQLQDHSKSSWRCNFRLAHIYRMSNHTMKGRVTYLYIYYIKSAIVFLLILLFALQVFHLQMQFIFLVLLQIVNKRSNVTCEYSSISRKRKTAFYPINDIYMNEKQSFCNEEWIRKVESNSCQKCDTIRHSEI